MSIAVFLRGINVGGRTMISMAALRTALESNGYTGVQTLLQSGNVVLSQGKAADLEKLIKTEFGLDVRVMTRTHAELLKVIAGNPFKQHEGDGAKLAVAFLEKAPGKVDLDPAHYEPDEFIIKGKEMYLWFPNGMGRSKIGDRTFQKGIGDIASTVRNWNTLNKMAELTS